MLLRACWWYVPAALRLLCDADRLLRCCIVRRIERAPGRGGSKIRWGRGYRGKPLRFRTPFYYCRTMLRIPSATAAHSYQLPPPLARPVRGIYTPCMNGLVEAPQPLTAERLEKLAYELALEYHAPEDLEVQFGLPEGILAQMLDMPEFQRRVHAARRQIDEAGDQTRLVARKMVAELVPVIAQLVNNAGIDAKDRIAAFKTLKELAGITENDKMGAGGAFAIQINIG